MDLGVAYASGLAASVSPCVIVLIPLVVYRFGSIRNDSRKLPSKRSILAFVAGFEAFFIACGYFLRTVFTSALQDGVKMGMGAFFIVMAFLCFVDKLDPTSVHLFGNTFLLGGR